MSKISMTKEQGQKYVNEYSHRRMSGIDWRCHFAQHGAPMFISEPFHISNETGRWFAFYRTDKRCDYLRGKSGRLRTFATPEAAAKAALKEWGPEPDGTPARNDVLRRANELYRDKKPMDKRITRAQCLAHAWKEFNAGETEGWLWLSDGHMRRELEAQVWGARCGDDREFLRIQERRLKAHDAIVASKAMGKAISRVVEASCADGSTGALKAAWELVNAQGGREPNAIIDKTLEAIESLMAA